MINQMFAYCCGYATIVAQRQPLLRLIEAAPATRAGQDFAAGSARAVHGHNPGAIDNEVSPAHIASHVIAGAKGKTPRVAESHATIRTMFAATDLSIAAVAPSKSRRLTFIAFERDRVIFVRPALFARVFVT